ncbi:MAG: hypothetical protein Q8Q13_01845 [bacterium]|nr:hypothetical protein [bacterium]
MISGDELVAKSDKMFHHHGDILIKVFSVLVALVLLGLYFLTTSQAPFENTTDEIQKTTK